MCIAHPLEHLGRGLNQMEVVERFVDLRCFGFLTQTDAAFVFRRLEVYGRSHEAKPGCARQRGAPGGLPPHGRLRAEAALRGGPAAARSGSTGILVAGWSLPCLAVVVKTNETPFWLVGSPPILGPILVGWVKTKARTQFR